MPHDVEESSDHALAATPSSLVPAGGAAGPAFVPLAEPVASTAEAPAEFTPDQSPLSFSISPTRKEHR
jgi:hypothetical protein